MRIIVALILCLAARFISGQTDDIRIFLQNDTAYIFKTGKTQLTSLTVVAISEAPENGQVYDALTGNRRMSRDGQRLSVDLHADSIWSLFLPDDPGAAPLHSIRCSALSDLPFLDSTFSRQDRMQHAFSVPSAAPNIPYLQTLKKLPYLDSVYQCLRSDPLELYILAGDSLFLHNWNGMEWQASALGTLPVCAHFEVLEMHESTMVLAADGSMYDVRNGALQPAGILRYRLSDLILIKDLDNNRWSFLPLSYLQWDEPVSKALESASSLP